MKKFLIIAAIFLLLSSVAFAQPTGKNVGLQIDNLLRVDSNTNEVTPTEQEWPRELQIGAYYYCKETGSPPLGRLEISFSPAEEVKSYIENKWGDFTSENPYTIVSESIPSETGGISMGFGTETRTIKENFPAKITRTVNQSYFEAEGSETVTIKVMPNQKFSKIGVHFESVSTTDATVKFVSSSRDYFTNTDPQGRVHFEVSSPQSSQTYTFKIELKITPLKGQTTYIPGVFLTLGTTTSQEQSKGSNVSVLSEFGQISASASEEVNWNVQRSKGFGVWMAGVSTTGKFIEETITEEVKINRSSPSYLTSTGSKETGGVGLIIDWNQMGVFAALAIVGSGYFITRRRYGRAAKLMREIDVVYNSYKMQEKQCEAEMHNLKEKILEQFKKGKITDESFSILEDRIKDYIKELREQKVHGEWKEHLPHTAKDMLRDMLEDGKISDAEYKRFLKHLAKPSVKIHKEAELRQLIKKWREEDKERH